MGLRWEYNGAKQGKILSFLAYLDWRGDVEWRIQLDGWNPLGLRELGRTDRFDTSLDLVLSINALLSAFLVLGEPHKIMLNPRMCVEFGNNLNNPEKMADGVCKWSRHTYDCICKI